MTRSAGTSLYNDKWLEIRVPIPTTYTCTDCWWSIDYNTGGGTFFERTVWSINIDSDPLRLIEEAQPVPEGPSALGKHTQWHAFRSFSDLPHLKRTRFPVDP